MQVYHFKDKTDDFDAQFAEYLKGKSVAVVGCAALDNLEQGDFIDSHDVVIRMHSPIPYAGYEGQMPRADLGITPDWSTPMFVPREWQSRIGRRVDVFYHQVEFLDELKHFLPLFRGAGGKYLAREFWIHAYNYEYVAVCKRAPTRHLTHDHCINSMEAVGEGVYAGTQIIGDILRFDVGSIYLTGFPNFFDAEGKFISTAPPFERRMAFYNLDWLRRLHESYDEINVDENMKSLFVLMPHSYEEYMERYGRSKHDR